MKFFVSTENESAFDLLYCITFKLMDHQWLTMRASYMDFNVSFHHNLGCLFNLSVPVLKCHLIVHHILFVRWCCTIRLWWKLLDVSLRVSFFKKTSDAWKTYRLIGFLLGSGIGFERMGCLWFLRFGWGFLHSRDNLAVSIVFHFFFLSLEDMYLFIILSDSYIVSQHGWDYESSIIKYQYKVWNESWLAKTLQNPFCSFFFLLTCKKTQNSKQTNSEFIVLTAQCEVKTHAQCSLVDPGVKAAPPFCNSFWEPKSNLLPRTLNCITPVNNVPVYVTEVCIHHIVFTTTYTHKFGMESIKEETSPANINGIITTDGPWSGLSWVGGPNYLPASGYNVLTFPNHCHDRSRNNVLDQPIEEGLGR